MAEMWLFYLVKTIKCYLHTNIEKYHSYANILSIIFPGGYF